MNGAERYNFDTLRSQITDELHNKDMPQRLYKSTNAIFSIIDAIVKTKGEGWTAQALDSEGKPIFTQNEQVKFNEAFKPYIGVIIDYFDKDTFTGGANDMMYKPDVSKISDMSKDFIKTKLTQTTGVIDDPTKMFGVDDIYARIYNKIGNIDATVNEYASKYGVLRLEKEHDLEPDPRVIPKPAAMAISEGVFALSTAVGFPIPPNITFEVLSKVKIPFRTIIFAIYLALDVTRISMGVSDRTTARKLLSIVLAILELLRGDWKKSILTFIGFYGMTPLIAGEVMKVFLSLFRKLSPQIQRDIVFGSLDATKSLIIGLLLSVFQITAPEEVRLPLIGVLEKIAQRKAEIDGELVDEGLSARPDYLSPTFEDLNNIQAVMSDKAYLCSCEFDTLIGAVDKSAIFRIILQILRIPVTKEYKELICGTGPCKPFVQEVVSSSMKDKQKADELQGEPTLDLPVQLNPDDILTAPVAPTKATANAVEENNPANPEAEAEAEAEPKAELEEAKPEAELEEAKPETKQKAELEEAKAEVKAKPEAEAEAKPEPEVKAKLEAEPEVKAKLEVKAKPTVKGGRILHSRKRKTSI
jgi:hypothetical protein